MKLICTKCGSEKIDHVLIPPIRIESTYTMDEYNEFLEKDKIHYGYLLCKDCYYEIELYRKL